MPENVILEKKLLDALNDYCINQQPFEACGMLMGKQLVEDGIRVIRVEGFWPVKNISRSPEQTFELDPEAWVRHMSDVSLREQTIGVFHSHPSAPPVPSMEDVQGMWEFPVYLIISLAGKTPQAKSYQLLSGAYREQQLMIRNGSDGHKDPLNCSHPVHGWRKAF